jgi:tellurite resistance protein TerC
MAESPMNHPVLLGFAAITIAYLLLDLGILHKKPRALSFREALGQSLLIILIALSFGGFILYEKGTEAAIEYYSAYTMEYALSLDNVFVIMLILRYFSIPPSYHHRVLFWGVLGAVVMRGIFIFAGVLLVRSYHFVLYIFGAFLVYAGIRALFDRDEGPADLSQNWLLRFLTRRLRFTTEMRGGRFVLRIEGKKYFTPLMLALVLVEFTDLLFAVDSIPAAFAITQDEEVLFSSNIFAVMGLRSLFFLLSAGVRRFWAIELGISLILIGIGLKMFQDLIGLVIPTWYSLVFILGILTLSMVISVLYPKR